MSRTKLVLAGVASALALMAPSLLGAAELEVPPQAVAPARGADCGPCGCLSVTYVHHRELRATYGLGFDPRNYDTTQPHYYLGPERAYPRYFVDGVETGPC
jgi:hypothetical protein